MNSRPPAAMVQRSRTYLLRRGLATIQSTAILVVAMALFPQVAVAQSRSSNTISSPATVLAQQQDASQPELSETANAQDSALANRQSSVAERFKRLEALLLRLSELEAGENPTRSALLQQAAKLGKEQQLGDLLARAASSLEKEQISEAIEDQKMGRDRLKQLLELLQSENRGKRVREERDQVRRWIEETNRLLRMQGSLRGRTEGGLQSNQASQDQQRLENKAADIAKQLGPDDPDASETGDSQSDGSDSPNDDSQSDASESDSAESDSAEPNDAQSGASEASERKNGGEVGEGESKGTSEDSKSSSNSEQGNESQGGESQGTEPKGNQSEGNESEGSKPSKEDASSEPGNSNSEGSQGESQPGQEGDGKQSDGDPSQGEKSDGQQSQGQQSQGQQSQGQQSQGQQPQGQQSQGQQSTPQQQQPQSPTERAKQRIQQAQQQMREAKQALDEAENNAEKRQEAIENQLAAEENLRDAIEELEQILRQLREEEIERSLASLEDRFRRMLDMQNKVLDETSRLLEIAGEDPNNRQVSIKANSLSKDENKILAEGERAFLLLREEGSSAAFPEAVEQLNNDIVKVAQRLSDGDVDKLTVAIESEIVSALEEMIEALVAVQKENEEKRQQQQQQQGQPQQMQQGDQPLVDQLAELRLILTLQKRINKRTDAMSKMLDDPQDAVGQAESQDIVDELRGLSDRQSKIGKVTRNLLQSDE